MSYYLFGKLSNTKQLQVHDIWDYNLSSDTVKNVLFSQDFTIKS